MNHLTGYLGTYASVKSPGIFRFTIGLDDGVLSVPELYCEAPDCKYLSLCQTTLAAPVSRGGQAGLCLLDTAEYDKNRLTAEGKKAAAEVFSETAAACYVTQDSRFLYTVNYHEGSILIYEKTESGPKLYKRLAIAPKAGCHQILFHKDWMLVPCLLLDCVKLFDCSRNFAPSGELRFPEGTGPRHGVFDREHRRLFLVSELSNQLFVYRTDGLYGQMTGLSPENIYEILPKGKQYSQAPASAAIRLSPDECFLYVSTRFADVITVFSIDGCTLKQVQQTGSGGVHPRDILLTPDGRWLLAANRTEGGLVSFPVDRESGRLGPVRSRVPAPEAVSIALENK